MRKFFWLLVFLFVFAFQVLAVEITQVGKVVAPHPNTGEEFLILVSDNFWQVPEVQEAISQYQDDVYQHRQIGSRVFAVTPCFVDNCDGTGGDLEAAEEIRDFLSQEYYEKHIIGAILIGDIAFVPVWYRSSRRWASQGPFDIFFADLDYDFSSRLVWKESWEYPDQGTWYFDIPSKGGFPSYDGKPEIWVSRILPPVREMKEKTEEGKWRWYDPNLEERVEMLLRFFKKDHRYWEGENRYRDFAYFVEEKIYGCDDYYWPIFPECQVNRRTWCSRCNSKGDYFNLPETRLIYFSAHGGPFGIEMCPECSNPEDRNLYSLEIYYTPVPVNIVITDSCDTFNFSIGVLSVGQAFMFGNSDAVSGIGAGIVGGVGKLDSRPYFSTLSVGDLWKEMVFFAGGWSGIEDILMGDPFVKVCASTVDITPPEVTIDSLSCSVNGGTITFSASATDPSGIGAISLFKTTDPSWNTYDILKTCYNTTYCSANFSGQPGKTYYLQVNATDKHGNLRVKKTSVTCLADTTGPTITIYPLSCPVNGGTITVKAEAEDPSGIGAMTIFKKRSDQSSFDVLKECGAVASCSASFFGEAGETYDIHVHAIDGDGNLSIKGTTVTCFSIYSSH